MSKNSVARIVTEGAQCRIVYCDGAGEITERVILVDRVYPCTSKGRCLVVAHCFRRNEVRSFDMARILAAMPDDSTQITTFAMSAAVTAHDVEAFSKAYTALHGRA